MVFQKTEWYLFILAAFTLSLVYYVAFSKNVGTIFGGTSSLIGQVMGRNASGAFQAPF
jgi:hypothetical protein